MDAQDRQKNEGQAIVDPGSYCLDAIARYHRLPAEAGQLKHQFGRDGAVFDTQDLLRAAKALGKISVDQLNNHTLPAIGLSRDGGYFIIAKVSEPVEESRVLVQRMDRRGLQCLTLFVIAHRLSTVHQCDRIVVMDRGRILESGSHADLIAAGGEYARLHRFHSDIPDISTRKYQNAGRTSTDTQTEEGQPDESV